MGAIMATALILAGTCVAWTAQPSTTVTSYTAVPMHGRSNHFGEAAGSKPTTQPANRKRARVLSPQAHANVDAQTLTTGCSFIVHRVSASGASAV